MAASMWRSRIEDFVKGEEDSSINEIARDLLTKELKLLELVEALGPYLTSVEKHTRCRGTQLLAETLHRLPHNYLKEKEVDVIVVFFCDRLKDHHTVTPHVLNGMVALSQFAALSDMSTETMVRGIFKEVHVQSMGQGHRYHVYRVLANLLVSKLEALKKMGRDFVYGYIQAMDGEKDPRNLLVAFDSVTTIAQEWESAELNVFIEELFEVVGCYFPVDFTPPPNDPYGIKKEDLIMSLRHCLAASPKFAEYCLPLLLEKATAATKSARVDALQTLAACAENYGSDVLKEYLGSFWSCIRREVLAGDDLIEPAALGALTSMTRTLSNQFKQQDVSLLHTFITDIFKDCEKYLREPELKLMYPTSKILNAVIVASDIACCKMLMLVIPLLLEEFHKHKQANARQNIVDVLNSFIRAAGSAYSFLEWQSLVKESLGPLLQSLMTHSNNQLRVLGVQGISALQDLPNMASLEDRGKVASHLYNIITQDTDLVVRDEAVLALARMGASYPGIVKERALDPLLSFLGLEKMEVCGAGDAASTGSHMTADYILHTVAALSTQHELVQASVPQYFQHITHLDSRDPSEDNLAECRTTCRCLCRVIRTNCSSPESLQFLQTCVVSRCFDLAVSAAISERENSVLLDPGIVDLLATAVRTVIQCLDNSALSGLVSLVVQAYLHGNTASLSSHNNNANNFKPLDPSSPWQHGQVIPLMTSVLCSLPAGSEIPELPEILESLKCVSLTHCQQYCSRAAAKCYAALLNKHPINNSLSVLLENTQGQLECVIMDTGQLVTARIRALWLWICVTKALILMGHPKQTTFINKIITLLDNSELAETAADGFRLVLCEFDDVMSPAMHANIRLMYRQRFFMQTHSQLIEGFNKAEEVKKQYYLTALSHHLKFVPKSVLMGELPKLLPLLVQSLSFENIALQLSTMTTLKDLLTQEPQLLVNYVDDVIPQLLKLVQFKPNMKVRIAALGCLSELTNLPSHVVVPHQPAVVRSLASLLDDHKRLVRQEAVHARCEWYLVGTASK